MDQLLKDAIQTEQQIKAIYIVDTKNILVRLLKKKLAKYVSSTANVQGNLQKQKIERKAVEVHLSQNKSPPKSAHTERLVTPIPTAVDNTCSDPSPEPHLEQKDTLQQIIGEVAKSVETPLHKKRPLDTSSVATSSPETSPASSVTLFPDLIKAEKQEVTVPLKTVDVKVSKLETPPALTPTRKDRSSSVSSFRWTPSKSKFTLKRIKSAIMTVKSLPKNFITLPTLSKLVKTSGNTTQKAVIDSSLPQTPQIPKYKVPCGFNISNGIQVFIHKCDITRLEIDAIVNLTNKNLDHPAGVTKAIFDAGGEQLEKERKEQLSRSGHLSVTETVVTSGGLLPCKMVIHAVGPTWPFGDDDKKKTDCFKLLRETFINIFHTGDKKTITSLAVPAVISGNRNI